MSEGKPDLLRRIPSMTDLLKSPVVAEWLKAQPAQLVTDCLRAATAQARAVLVRGGDSEISDATILSTASTILQSRAQPRVREAINATGVILHTGLGRSVFPGSVVDSIIPALKGYCTLAVDCQTGDRVERDELIEHLLVELTGAEAATLVNNNAAATLLVLAGLAAGKEVIVSRGQLIEIGGSFRLPEVMAQSGARLVEIGATNRTHLKDYARAIRPDTGALMRVHPSNYRILGFTSQPELPELAELAHKNGLVMVDDLGAGALVALEQFGLPHEPTVRESIASGADVVLFSGDKLIGGAQAGIIVGRKALVDRLRKHPLMRAMRVDKTCLLILERTLALFRDPDRLRQTHPVYRMTSTPIETLRSRAAVLLELFERPALPSGLSAGVTGGLAYLGSGSLPTESIPSVVVALETKLVSPDALAKRLRVGSPSVFGRIEGDRLLLDMRTITDEQLPLIAQAVRAAAQTHSAEASL